MLQWSLRITAYADRLLEGLNNLDWSESIKETQKNWIGKSQGAHVKFEIPEFQGESIQVFTTRPDTIFGVSFIVIAPEHPVLSKITIESQKNEVTAYQQESMKRTERERQTNIKMTSGAFTGAYAKHPISGKKLTIWTSDYVLMGYGTGAIMAVPGHDSRDWNFAKHFNLPIIQVVEGGDIKQGAIEDKNGSIINSDFLDGYNIEDAILSAIEHMKKNKWGTTHVQFRLRDAVFGRQ